MRATKESIIAFIDSIKERYKGEGLEKIALFGSFARMQNGVYSDIDIAIKKSTDYFEHHNAHDYFETLDKLKSEFRKKFHRNIDILDLDSTSPYLDGIKEEMIVV